jgi:prevent-host-death family protein
MRTQRPRTKTITVTAARQAWSELLNTVSRGETRVLVEKRGIPVAAIVSIEDLERLNRLDAERDQDFAVLDEVGAAFKDVPVGELERQVAKALAEVRAEMRAERDRRKPTVARSA